MKRIWLSVIALVLLVYEVYAQKPFREYPGREYEGFPIPDDWKVPGEWAFARLMYPPAYGGRGWGRRGGGMDWRQGGSSWTTDYPRSDRHLSEAVRRLTRIQTRSVEQSVNGWRFMLEIVYGVWCLPTLRLSSGRGLTGTLAKRPSSTVEWRPSLIW